MGKKQLIVAWGIMISIFCFSMSFAQSASIVNRDTYGAYTIEGSDKYFDVILAKDTEALSLLVLSGQIVNVKKGTSVFIEDTSIWRGLTKVRPQGQIRSIWVPMETLVVYNSETNSKSKPKKIIDENTDFSLEVNSIVYDAKGQSYAIVNETVVKVGDKVHGVEILEIGKDFIKFKYKDKIWAKEFGLKFEKIKNNSVK